MTDEREHQAILHAHAMYKAGQRDARILISAEVAPVLAQLRHHVEAIQALLGEAEARATSADEPPLPPLRKAEEIPKP